MTESRKPSAVNSGPSRKSTPWFVALGCFAALSLVSRVLGEFLLDKAAGRGVVFFVYLGWMALILVAGAGAARAAIKASFPDQDGMERGEPGERLDVRRLSSVFQPVTVYFSLLAVLFSLAAMFLAQWSSRGALFEFKAVQLEAMARSDDPHQIDQFFSAVEAMGDPQEVQHFVRMIPPFFSYPDESVREAAFNAMAVMGHRMNLSVALLGKDRALIGDRWEPDVVAWMRDEVSLQLAVHWEKGTTPRSAVLRAAAWLFDSALSELFVQVVDDPATTEDVFREAAIGLGNLGTLEGGEALSRQAERYPGQTRLYTLWALQQIGRSQKPDDADDEYGDRVLAVVRRLASYFPRQDDACLCALVLTVGAFQHVAVTEELIALFESERGILLCPRVEIRLPYGPPVAYVSQQKLRWILLNIFASIAGNNVTLGEWVDAAARRDIYDEEITKGLAQLNAQLQRE
ncbi:MAG: hypothetical protein FJ109_06905 [Deltaproteobacteria bacterium]|nr:hypothetical protein [Deltaproteobacteria bacterium]